MAVVAKRQPQARGGREVRQEATVEVHGVRVRPRRFGGCGGGIRVAQEGGSFQGVVVAGSSTRPPGGAQVDEGAAAAGEGQASSADASAQRVTDDATRRRLTERGPRASCIAGPGAV